MPENNQILSIGNQLVGMPLAGPESFSQEQIAYLKRALGVDETVLWSGTCNTNSSVTLSESYKNFEKIRICGYHASGAGMSTEAYTSDIMATAAKEITLQSWVAWSNSAYYKFAMSVPCDFTSDTVLATRTGRFVGYWDNTWKADNSTDIILTRVVGIHRIAGGN